MIFLIIQYTILSLLLISIFHYLYIFFKNNLTVPKVKDLVNKPASAYSEIYETINKDISKINSDKNDSNTYQDDSNLNMKDELKKYLSKLNSTPGDTNEINNQNNINDIINSTHVNGMNINNMQDWGNNYSTL
jgi:hypothetical protein